MDEEQTIILAFNCKEISEDMAEIVINQIEKLVTNFKLIQVLMLPKSEWNAYEKQNMRKLDFSSIITSDKKRIH